MEGSDLSPLANVDDELKAFIVLYGASLAAFHLSLVVQGSPKYDEPNDLIGQLGSSLVK